MAKTNAVPAKQMVAGEAGKEFDRILAVQWRMGRVSRKLKVARLQYRDDHVDVLASLEEAA